MKIKSVIALVLAIVCLLPIVTGVGTAQRENLNKVDFDYTVYLPFVSKPPCPPKGTAAYVATNKPVVRVGEILTVTGALVNECNPLVGMPAFYVFAKPSDILSPSLDMRYGFPPSVSIGEYEEVTFTLRAVGPGVVTVTVTVNYETTTNCNPPGFCYDIVGSSPTVVRVLP